MGRHLLILALVSGSLSIASAARAQATAPFGCGVHCQNPGKRILCNDSLPDNGMPTTVDCSASLGSCNGEAYCATFTAPGDVYPAYLNRVWALIGPGPDVAHPFTLEVYEEDNTLTPGLQIQSAYPNSWSLVGDATLWQFMDLTSSAGAFSFDAPIRICLRKQFDYDINVCMDADGQSAQNWMFADIYLGTDPDNQPACDPNYLAGFPTWQQSSTFGAANDFAIRAEIFGAVTSEWSDSSGVCYTAPRDAGPTLDSGGGGGGNDAGNGGSDAGNNGGGDAGGSGDGGVVSDGGGNSAGDGGGSAADSGATSDAGAGTGDSGASSGDDAGAGDAGNVAPGGPPMITTITPDEGSTTAATDVTVLGSGFVAGLALTIGTIPAGSITVSGATTIDARVPANIAAGVYDVLVRNPDGQVALLANGFTVVDPAAAGVDAGGNGDELPGDDIDNGTVPAGCGCRATSSAPADALLILLGFGALATLRVRRRHR